LYTLPAGVAARSVAWPAGISRDAVTTIRRAASIHRTRAVAVADAGAVDGVHELMQGCSSADEVLAYLLSLGYQDLFGLVDVPMLAEHAGGLPIGA
jgi:hypothetical protein